MKHLKLSVIAALLPLVSVAQVDYSVVYVNEEAGLDLTRITTDNDYVCMPRVQRRGDRVFWLSNKIIDVSKDGKSLAYLSARNNTTNIFIYCCPVKLPRA